MKRLILATIALCALSTAIVEGSTWTIPGITNVPGANGTHFVSDLALTNPGAVPAIATVTFVPGGLASVDVPLGPGQTVVYRNIVDRLWHASLGGAVEVTSDSPLLLRARTYNNAATGTFGVALPVFDDDQMLSLGDTADSLWVSQSSSYRTNIGVVFPDDDGGAASVTVYDADGKNLGTQEFGTDAPGFQQFSVAGFAGSVAAGRAELVVRRGRAAGYSVVVDNFTGDSSLFSFDDLPAGYQDVLVNGVARANGKNGTFFRTDGRFYNPSAEDADVTVAYLASQNGNPSPATATFKVPAGKILDVIDVLASLLALPVGSAGALRFSSDTPVAVLCRTSNVDPTGVKPGTFGAQQKPVQLLAFQTSSDGPAVVTGIRQNGDFRTNIGFTSGADGAAYNMTLQNASGVAVATASGSLGPFGFAQPGVQAIFGGTTVPDDATLLVQVTSGSVAIYDSSIDNVSGDSVVTPIMPVPVDIPSSATIGADGGSIRSTDGIMTLRIPAGALSSAVAFTLTQAPNDGPGALGSGYDLSPGNVAFARPALLSFNYGPSGLDVADPGAIAVAFATGSSWTGLTGGRIDASARTLTVSIGSTGPAIASLPQTNAANASGRARYITLWGLEVQSLRTWVPTDGSSAHNLVEFHLPPSGSGKVGTTYLMSDLNLDPINVSVFTPPLGNVTRQSAGEFTYTAPHSIAHASVPVDVHVRVHVTRGAGVPFGDYDAIATFHVLRRRWGVNVQFKLNVACVPGTSSADFSYSYSDDQAQNYVLGDDLTLTAEPFLGGLPSSATVTACKCTATLMGQPGTVQFQFFGGSLVLAGTRRARFQMVSQAEILDMIPAIQEVCPNPILPPPSTITYNLDGSGRYEFDFQLGLAGTGGLRPVDGTSKFIVDEPPLLKVVVEWHSLSD